MLSGQQKKSLDPQYFFQPARNTISGGVGDQGRPRVGFFWSLRSNAADELNPFSIGHFVRGFFCNDKWKMENDIWKMIFKGWDYGEHPATPIRWCWAASS
jgi:hypothetical protein